MSYENFGSAVHIIIKKLRGSEEISALKGQTKKPVLNDCGLRAFSGPCIENRHDPVVNITE